jgi:Kef-type K+ transport system membrane component KefB
MNTPHPLGTFDLSVLFFLQMAFILAVCRVVGAIFKKLGQSQVVSEMIAGVIMGPSLLGLVSPGVAARLTPWIAGIMPGYHFPNISATLFPPESKPIIFAVCQIGLVLYMFLIGAEFDLSLIRSRIKSAASISAAGIITPFALGSLLALKFAGDTTLFSEKASTTLVVLFMGASMSITAFPMLARIIYEQGLTKTSLGVLAIAAGSMDDAAAWCVLAIVLAAFANNPSFAVIAIGGGILYALFTIFGVSRLLKRLGEKVEREGQMSNEVLIVALCLAMLGAWFTDYIRIYAVFGAFLMGIAMPRGLFQKELEKKILPLTTNFLLPVFFVYSGLNTRIGLVDSWHLWGLTGLVMLAAVGGKFGACMLAAKFHGESWKEATAIGTLMNARGLMELILLNIGLERGIIKPPLFAILVMMAILTTLMATPIFERIYGSKSARDAAAMEIAAA